MYRQYITTGMNKKSKCIIDIHTHVSREKSSLFSMPEEWVLGAMEKYGIDFCLVSDADCAECDHNKNIIPEARMLTQEEALLRDIKFAKKHSGKIGLCVWIKPLTEGYSKELENIITEYRKYIYGLKIHPYHSDIAPDSDRVKPYLDMASRFALPVISHTGMPGGSDSVEHLYNAAKMYTDVKFIMAHMGLGTDNAKALDVMGKADNLYADTAWVPYETVLKAVEMYGSDRIMFGSDMPIDGLDTYYYNRSGQPSMYREYFEKLPDMLSVDDYDNIMYKTASRVFEISF